MYITDRKKKIIDHVSSYWYFFHLYEVSYFCISYLYIYVFLLFASGTFSMDPFWKTCCSSQTTQYSLSVGILCSEYFIICLGGKAV